MNALRSALLVAVATLIAGASQAQAQQARAPLSPPDIQSAVVEGNRVTVFYSRPYTKDPKTGEPRQIWGKLVPFNEVWRTGANASTMLTTQKDIKIGDLDVPAGAYTLYTLPTEDGGKLIINKQLGQWGTQYDEKQDLGRVDMKMDKLDKPVDQFTMTVGKGKESGGVIKLMWVDRQYTVPFTVKK
jgi:hypothetical protein